MLSHLRIRNVINNVVNAFPKVPSQKHRCSRISQYPFAATTVSVPELIVFGRRLGKSSGPRLTGDFGLPGQFGKDFQHIVAVDGANLLGGQVAFLQSGGDISRIAPRIVGAEQDLGHRHCQFQNGHV